MFVVVVVVVVDRCLVNSCYCCLDVPIVVVEVVGSYSDNCSDGAGLKKKDKIYFKYLSIWSRVKEKHNKNLVKYILQILI